MSFLVSKDLVGHFCTTQMEQPKLNFLLQTTILIQLTTIHVNIRRYIAPIADNILYYIQNIYKKYIDKLKMFILIDNQVMIKILLNIIIFHQ